MFVRSLGTTDFGERYRPRSNFTQRIRHSDAKTSKSSQIALKF
jgi:hypothetical protein